MSQRVAEAAVEPRQLLAMMEAENNQQILPDFFTKGAAACK